MYSHDDYHNRYDEAIECVTKLVLSSGHQIFVPNVSYEQIQKDIEQESCIHLSFVISEFNWSNVVKDGYIASDQIVCFYPINLRGMKNSKLKKRIFEVVNPDNYDTYDEY